MAAPKRIDDFKEPTRAKLRREGMNIFGMCVPNLGKKRSFASILYLAMFADGEQSPEEVEELFALLDRTKTFANTSKRQSQQLIEQIEADVKKHRAGPLLELASRCFRTNDRQRESIFMHAADIVFADRNVVDNEKKLLADLAFYLKLEKERARQLLTIMQLKNRH